MKQATVALGGHLYQEHNMGKMLNYELIAVHPWRYLYGRRCSKGVTDHAGNVFWQ
jgi:hypothetical protein